MKLAILADIHGNSAALRAALTDARKAGAAHLLILGDMVGYYYDIRGVLEQLAEWPSTAIGGNHEHMLGEMLTDISAAARYREKYGSALDVAKDILTDAQKDWLIGLPSRATVEMGGTAFDLCHGAPDDRDRYVYPTASESELTACDIPGSVVLMGHTHYPLVARRRECILLNPGSVGQARDFGGFAAWMTYDTETGVAVSRRSEYDVSALRREAHERDPHLRYLVDILIRNRIAATP
jgi:putative phosphoesterase